ncbi:MAG: RNA methyltransferase, partial [Lachnospiraceae bacterium]|nr:RNA methyltransferase [Lachnospiraceae bacterium]
MEIIRINDLHDGRLEMYTELNEVQLKRFYEPAGGVFVAETELVISRALAAGCRPVSFLIEEKCFAGGILDTYA